MVLGIGFITINTPRTLLLGQLSDSEIFSISASCKRSGEIKKKEDHIFITCGQSYCLSWKYSWSFYKYRHQLESFLCLKTQTSEYLPSFSTMKVYYLFDTGQRVTAMTLGTS